MSFVKKNLENIDALMPVYLSPYDFETKLHFLSDFKMTVCFQSDGLWFSHANQHVPNYESFYKFQII